MEAVIWMGVRVMESVSIEIKMISAIRISGSNCCDPLIGREFFKNLGTAGITQLNEGVCGRNAHTTLDGNFRAGQRSKVV